jgi:hypothetical protein
LTNENQPKIRVLSARALERSKQCVELMADTQIARVEDDESVSETPLARQLIPSPSHDFLGTSRPIRNGSDSGTSNAFGNDTFHHYWTKRHNPVSAAVGPAENSPQQLRDYSKLTESAVRNQHLRVQILSYYQQWQVSEPCDCSSKANTERWVRLGNQETGTPDDQ